MLSRPSRLVVLAIAAAAVLACTSTALAAPPPNDTFANATTLNPTQTVGTKTAGTLDGATTEPGEYGAAAGMQTVWYRVAPSYTGTLTLDVCDASFPVQVSAFTGASVDAVSPAGMTADLVCPSQYSGSGSLHVTAGKEVRIRVASWGAIAAGSQFTLRLNSPHNDDLGAAQPLDPDSYGARDHLFGATKQVNEADHAGDTGGHSVWFNWTSGAAGPAKFSTCSTGTGFDTLLAIYQGGAFPLTPVASNDDDLKCANPGASTVTFNAAAHATYRVAVDAYHSMTPEQIAGGFFLGIPPDNDQLADAAPITGSLYSGSWSYMATKEAGEPAHAGQPGGASVWWAWTATANGPTTFDTCSQYPDTADTLLAVYTGSSYPLTPVASNDDTARCGLGKSSLVTFDAVAGTTYKIAVDDKSGHGDYLFINAAVPDNDFFAHPDTLTGSGSLEAGLDMASAEPGEPQHAGSPAMDSRWWTYTAPADGTVRLDTCATTKYVADTTLAVYTGDAVGALTPIASSDDVAGCGLFNDGSSVEFAATAGTTYRIALDLKDGYGGPVTLTYSGPGAPLPPPPPPSGKPQGDGPLLGAVHLSRARLSRLAHGRFIVTAACLRACGLAARLSARRHPVASGAASAGAAKTLKLHLRVPPRKRAAMLHRRTLRTTLLLTAIDPKTHAAAKVIRTVRFRR